MTEKKVLSVLFVIKAFAPFSFFWAWLRYGAPYAVSPSQCFSA